MKNYLLIGFALFLASKTVLLAQNWAPFQFDEKIIYATPDTFKGTIPGKSLYLVQFDTSFFRNGNRIKACKKCSGITLLGNNGSYTNGSSSQKRLFGREVEQIGDQFFFYKDSAANPAVVTYFSKAKVGKIGLQASNCTGTVVSKFRRFIAGQPDSVKVISLEFLDGAQETITIEVSKNEGFLSFPYFLGQTGFKRLIFSRTGNFDDDLNGIKSFNGESKNYELNDEFSYYTYDYLRYTMTFTSCGVRKTNHWVTNVFGDSCKIIDSTLNHSCSLQPLSLKFTSRNIVNIPGIQVTDSTLRKELSTNLSTKSPLDGVKLGFLSNDGFLFVSLGYVGSLIAESGSGNWLSTEFPIRFHREYWYGGDYLKDYYTNPVYFKRGSRTFGQPFNLTFTSTEDKIANSFSIYPNPASDFIFIKPIDDSPFSISIYNLQGKIMLEKEMQSTSPINVRKFQDGLYFYAIQSGTKVSKGRFVKEK